MSNVRQTGQNGAVMLLLLGIISVIAICLTFIVESERLLLAQGQLKNVADTASYAGASHLLPDVFPLNSPLKKRGWISAKDAALRALDLNKPVLVSDKVWFAENTGYGEPSLLAVAAPDLNLSEEDPLLFQTVQRDNLLVTIERGIWYADENGQYSFLGLDSANQTTVDIECPGLGTPICPTGSIQKVWEVADAVRVTLEIDSPPFQWLTGFIGYNAFGRVRVSSIAIAQLEEEQFSNSSAESPSDSPN